MAYIEERHLPKAVDGILSLGEKAIGKRMLPARLLLWYPKAFISSMILEGLITHRDKVINRRMLKLIRMQVSLTVACPFCIDMNSKDFRTYGINKEEIEAMQGHRRIKDVSSFSYKEKLVLYYVKGLASTPVSLNPKLVAKMKKVFDEREYTIINTTAAQVDYWTRVIYGFGIQPAGFLDSCDLDYFR